ncbi:MAG: helix-turn-helix transcriptional regulator [Erysipelothrix sp.]|jgi:DNA-binding HxlR family transcriptional regulator|nr:helix-turn-helix transcriptional regulator [Erysipelothrix sp.]
MANACPYITQAFSILSKKWSGIILHTLSLNLNDELSFTEIKEALQTITPRALSIRLNELIEYNLIKKIDYEISHTYQLTEQGKALVDALAPIEKWAHDYFV